MNKNKNKGCISGILGTFFVLLGVFAYAVISSLLNRLFVSTAHGNSVACALMTNWLIGIGIAFLLYEAIFILWQFDVLKKSKNQNDGGRSNKTFKLIVLVCIIASLLVGVIFANTYTDCRENSISKVCFVTIKEYKWDEKNDILRYSLSCDEVGGLSFKIIMKDGEIIELLGHVTSLTNQFRESFNCDSVNLLGYAAYLSQEFDTCEFLIEKNISGVEHMEKYYKEQNPQVWALLETIIN